MKLSECKIGVLVCKTPEASLSGELEIGHIVGLSDIGLVAKKIVPLVQFAGEMHPLPYDFENLDLFTAF